MSLNKTCQQIFFLVLFFLIFSNSVVGLNNEKKIITPQQNNTIRYIGNMGVLITINGVQVLVDGLHLPYEPDYLAPSSALVDSIIHSKGNYTINYLLVTHVHLDHFNAKPVMDLLLNNQDVQLIAPKQVIDTLKKNEHFNKVAQRVLDGSLHPELKAVIGKTLVSITAHPILHTWQQRHFQIQNMAYRIDISGIRILHVGDADNKESTLSVATFLQEEHDVAIVPDWFLGRNSASLTQKYFRAKQFIGTHIHPVQHNTETIHVVTKQLGMKATLFTKNHQYQIL